jgi:PAS domain S-box-containing protein
MNQKLRILFVEDNINDYELICHEIGKSKISFEKLRVENKEDYVNRLYSYLPDLIISDYSLPQFDGMTALLLRNEQNPFIPFILVTGSINEEVAVECMKAGADDYILKENVSRLGSAVFSSIKKIKLLKEKQLAEQELYKSKIRLQKAQTIAHVGNWELNISAKTITCSDEALRIYGLDLSKYEYPLEFAQEIPLPEYREMLNEAIERLMKYNEHYEVEFKIRRINDKNIRYIYSKAELLKSVDNNQVFVIGVIQDITDRKKAEEELLESEKKFRRIFENIQDVYFESLLDGTLLEVSSAIGQLTKGQYKPSDLIGKSLSQLFSMPEANKEFLDKLYKNGRISDFEANLLIREGELIPCSISSKLIIGTEGTTEKIIGSIRDVSERKKSQEALQQSLDFSESLLKTIPFGMDIVDEEGTIVFQSYTLKNLFGEDVVGKKCWELYCDNKLKCNDCPLNHGIKIGETGIYEANGVFGNRIFEISHTGMIYQGKLAMLEIFLDITEKKLAEQELIKERNRAEASDRLKTAFLHNVSHEIRTPMNAIVGFSALLGEQDVDKETRQSYIDVIIQSSNHLLGIINDIVDISNIEANLIKLSLSQVNINAILRSIYKQYQLKANEKNLFIESKLPLQDTEADIFTDSTKLIQIINNLLNNALKFTSEGHIIFGYTLKNNNIEFYVSDTGIGIAEEYHKKIFDRFFRVENPKQTLYDGTGLGLAICRAYVEMIGGEIWLSSVQGVGSTFYFTVPYERAMTKRESVNNEKNDLNFVFRKKIKVLVAEDVESNLKLIDYFLRGSNANIIKVSNGKEAVEKMEDEANIDIILMDLKMPLMDGYSATMEIRKSFPDIPIIAQTAYADDKEKAMKCGCTGFISKPFDKKTLINAMKEFI